jgi:acetylornithine deacetylase
VQELDEAIAALAPRAFEVLERLVAEPSTVGQESGAEEVLAAELERLGFSITRLAIPEDIAADPLAGIPSRSYEGRYDLIGRRGAAAAARTLLINGHIDVVPADDASRWTTPPFQPSRRDGWLYGRGAGDMKGGFAAGLLALWALDQTSPGWLSDGALTWVAAIEEESTGNGTLAAGRAGYLAEAALLLEPTDLRFLLAGISIIWIDIEIEGQAGHAEAAQDSVNPILSALPVIEALQRFERGMNDVHLEGDGADEVFRDIRHPYNVNLGTFHAGDWASSVASVARLQVRVGHPAAWSSDEAFARVQAAVADAASLDPWLAENPPRLSFSGYRAERYAQEPEGELITRLARAHEQVAGERPQMVSMGSTTDARYYLNQFGMPAVAYGPRTKNMHGTDEAVELDSIVECARAVARFLVDWYSAGESV